MTAVAAAAPPVVRRRTSARLQALRPPPQRRRRVSNQPLPSQQQPPAETERRRRRSARISRSRGVGVVEEEKKEEQKGLPATTAEEYVNMLFPAEVIQGADQMRQGLEFTLSAWQSLLNVIESRKALGEEYQPSVNLPTALRNRLLETTSTEERFRIIRGLVRATKADLNDLVPGIMRTYAAPYLLGQTYRWWRATITEPHQMLAVLANMLFGVDNALSEKLTSLQQQLQERIDAWDHIMSGEDVLVTSIGLPVRSTLKLRIEEILELLPETRALLLLADIAIRKTCANQEDPFGGDPIGYIPPSRFFQTLNNRQCYDIQGLIDYIKLTSNGRNELPLTADQLNSNKAARRAGLPPPAQSAPIWSDEQPSDEYEVESDYERLTDHPLATEAQLREFIKSRSAAAVKAQLTEPQIERIKQLGEIMQSEGPAFVQAAQQYFTEEEMSTWLTLRSQQKERPDNDAEVELPLPIRSAVASNAPESSVLSRLKYKINDQIKPPALLEFIQFVDSQPQTFRDALDALSPGIVKNLQECAAGQACIMIVGRSIQRVYAAVTSVV